MKRRLSVGVAIALLATLATSGSVAAAPFQNGSFEQPSSTAIGSFGTYGVGSTAITGWTVGTGTIDWVASSYWVAADGSRSIDLNGYGPGSIYQTLDTSTGHTYRVTFAMSGNPVAERGVKTLTAFALSGTDATTASFSYDTSLNARNNTTGDMKWQSMTFTFVAKAASSTLTFLSTTSGTAFGPAIDNVTVTDITKSPEQPGAGKGGPGAQCKSGGWQHIAGHTFRNQGQCVSYFATKMRHGGAGPK